MPCKSRRVCTAKEKVKFACPRACMCMCTFMVGSNVPTRYYLVQRAKDAVRVGVVAQAVTASSTLPALRYGLPMRYNFKSS